MQLKLRQIHPVWQVLIGIAAVGIFGALAALGLFLFAILAVVGVVAGAVLWLRLWWLRRKLGGRQAAGEPGAIEGEFVVIRRRELDRDQES